MSEVAESRRPARYDIAIVGGGINGCGLARDAAGRGYSVLLVEQGDLGGATSSASTKLIHGGLRYLEHWEFRLVREALAEREVLLAAAPHIIRPMRFVLPHHAGLRPAWMLRLGLFLYDRLGGRRLLPGTRTLDLRSDPAGVPLRDAFTTGFEYSDCWVEDSRLVVLNAMDAAAKGADIRVRTRVTGARRTADCWRINLHDAEAQRRDAVEAGILVNAAGPWVGDLLSNIAGAREQPPIRLVQGSHIVVPRLFDHERAYIFQNADGRVVFAIPYEHDFTLIGTTDRDYDGDPAAVRITQDEIDYLCRAVEAYFRAPVDRSRIAWSFSGVRPLYDDGAGEAQEATRDYLLSLDEGEAGQAPLLNVLGGKITTYRKLAESALNMVRRHLPRAGAPWTQGAPLPGGDFPPAELDALAADLAADYAFLAPAHVRRLARAYGTRARDLLADARTADDLGTRFGADLTEAEAVYLMDEEWARTAEDIVWRRSKLGLKMTAEEIARLEAWMAARRQQAGPRNRKASERGTT